MSGKFSRTLTKEQVQTMEEKLHSSFQTTRLAFSFLMKSRQELMADVARALENEGSEKILKETVESIQDCVKTYEDVIKDMDSAWLRLADCIIELKEGDDTAMDEWDPFLRVLKKGELA